MFCSDVMCIDPSVDGLTKYKIYTVINVEEKEGKIYYWLHDDYYSYNVFLKDRFITITDELIENIIEYSKK